METEIAPPLAATKTLREALSNELKKRQAKNSAYSLRAFARHLDLSPAQLSQILSGKRIITLKTFNKLAALMCFSPDEQQLYLTEISQHSSASHHNQVQISEDQFRLISDWWHTAILNLACLPNYKKDSQKIAEDLEISIWETEAALARLERMQLIEAGEHLKRSKETIRVSSEYSSAAIQKSHQQLLDLAYEKIATVPVEQRDYSSMTMAIDPKNLSQARELIEEFQNKLMHLLERGRPAQVYTFSCQLFPLVSKKIDLDVDEVKND